MTHKESVISWANGSSPSQQRKDASREGIPKGEASGHGSEQALERVSLVLSLLELYAYSER